jgi:hypothetical protein
MILCIVDLLSNGGRIWWAKFCACTKIPRSVGDGFIQTCSIDKTVTTTASCTSCSCVTWIRFQSTGGLRRPCVLHAAKSMEAIRVKQGTRLPLFFPSILIKSAGYISILLTDVNSCFDVLDRHESCPFCKFRMAAR